jgi:DNA modification methylase
MSDTVTITLDREEAKELASAPAIDRAAGAEREVVGQREDGRAVHPTQKPLGILSPLIRYSVPGGGLVLDPFMGSGSTLLAARQLGRRAIGIELDEGFCRAAVRRLGQGELSLEAA